MDTRDENATAAATATSGDRARKRRGRPSSTGDEVGREGLIAATHQILKSTPPEEITRLLIAQQAGVDPALIRYYFGTVSHLITEVVVDAHARIQSGLAETTAGQSPEAWLRARIGGIVDLFVDNPYHHRYIRHVMYGPAGKNERDEWLSALRIAIDLTAAQINAGVEQGHFRPVDPRMLHILLIGVGEFFGSNPQVIEDMLDGEATVHGSRDAYVDFVSEIIINGLRRID